MVRKRRVQFRESIQSPEQAGKGPLDKAEGPRSVMVTTRPTLEAMPAEQPSGLSSALA
jgi:hypothetical protein